MAATDSLKAYKNKRNFAITSEPAEGGVENPHARAFVVQKHWARRLHYDFRLELDGTMKSWAIPKGPSLDPRDKRMAVHVEDHPIAYNQFEGEIPPKQYGAGKVIIWDKGKWLPLGDPHRGYAAGNLKFELRGHKLHGKWALIRMKGRDEKKEAWLLIKERDETARPADDYSVIDAQPDSVAKLETPPDKTPEKGGPHPNAPTAALPAELKPQLATLVSAPPDYALSRDWIYEVKFDGYRLLARVDKNSIQLFTRNGHDWSAKLPNLVNALRRYKLAPAWLDGEIVILNERGIPDFQALQNAFDQGRSDHILYYVFDLPFHAGRDLRSLPLIQRKNLLAAVFEPTIVDPIRLSDCLKATGQDLLASACQLGLEGIIGKRKTSTYQSRRSSDWIKLKCSQRQEFVIGGYTDPQGSRHGFGSLLLGVYNAKGTLQYSGNVGAGFSSKKLNEIKKQLMALATETRPFAGPTGIDRKAHWVEPKLIAEVSFGEWTKTGRVRHPVFHALRTDKPAHAITRELPRPMSSPLPRALKVSHPERVIDRDSGTTKLQLIEYYACVAPLLMEHLKGRPVSLVRAPDGIDGELFFQKHLDARQMPGVVPLNPILDPGHAPLLEVQKPLGLLSAAQMNVIEFHTWNALKTKIDKPDRMTFDLDPGKGVAWPVVQESAHLLGKFLKQLGLASFIKTSGGNGLHIIVPIKRLYGWDTVKGFSRAIVQHLAKTLPQRFSAKSGPRNRVGKIFIDYLRNGFGATTVAAWSARSRPGLGVSIPIAWAELNSLTGSAHWTLANIASRLSVGNQPWASYTKSAQSITSAMHALNFSTVSDPVR